jgi:hypothetical protein
MKDIRKTEEYQLEKQKASQMSDSQLILSILLDLYRDMQYKNALEFPGKPSPKPGEYVLEDEIRERILRPYWQED